MKYDELFRADKIEAFSVSRTGWVYGSIRQDEAIMNDAAIRLEYLRRCFANDEKAGFLEGKIFQGGRLVENLGGDIERGPGMYTGGTRSGETGVRSVPSNDLVVDFPAAHKRFGKLLEEEQKRWEEHIKKVHDAHHSRSAKSGFSNAREMDKAYNALVKKVHCSVKIPQLCSWRTADVPHRNLRYCQTIRIIQ